MADLKPLTDQIYHEKQQDGSMLCAQHALNSLLQGGYFTAPDLSAIAAKLDDLEGSLDTEGTSNGQRKESANMDDTGFFSIQVMDEALQLWGLRMVHWRSPEMKSHQATPNRQFAYILNLQQHWFTIRRFGLAQEPENATSEEADKSHWFNLNSFLDQPEWVGSVYLGMMLQQAEEEGYSVYAILRIDPESPLEMLRTPADEIASTLSLGELGLPSRLSTNRTRHPGSGPPEGLEDEDMELQAALQASMMDGVDQVTIPSGPIQPTPRRSMFADALPTDENDPVASSMARSRAIMDQMLRHQEAAFRETADDVPLPRRRRTRGEEEEEETLRAALEASQGDGHSDDDEEQAEATDPEFRPPPASTSQAATFAHQTGVYDDDDAAFQAALKASLEDMPEGATIPEVVATPTRASAFASGSASASVSVPAPPNSGMDEDEEYEEEDEDEKKKPQPIPEPSVDVDEMRKKRLARFGGS